MVPVVLAAAGSVDFSSLLDNADALGVVLFFGGLMASGKILWAREMKACQEENKEIKEQRDEYKQLLFNALDIGKQSLNLRDRR